MEDHQKSEAETHTAFFKRLIKEHAVAHFLVFWPVGARLLGWEKEAGDLLRWMDDGKLHPSQVYLMVEKALADDDEVDGVGALNEPQNRTRYHDDFLAYEVRVRFWDGMVWTASFPTQSRSLPRRSSTRGLTGTASCR